MKLESIYFTLESPVSFQSKLTFALRSVIIKLSFVNLFAFKVEHSTLDIKSNMPLNLFSDWIILIKKILNDLPLKNHLFLLILYFDLISRGVNFGYFFFEESFVRDFNFFL
jgi:hypothetical protein